MTSMSTGKRTIHGTVDQLSNSQLGNILNPVGFMTQEQLMNLGCRYAAQEVKQLQAVAKLKQASAIDSNNKESKDDEFDDNKDDVIE